TGSKVHHPRCLAICSEFSKTSDRNGNSPMNFLELRSACPEGPFRGLEPYRFRDQAIFFEREAELRKLLQLTTIYRASLLYGESGAGKSSLINAGFIPRILESGMDVERIRVQPILDHEFVVERIESFSPSELLPSILFG